MPGLQASQTVSAELPYDPSSYPKHQPLSHPLSSLVSHHHHHVKTPTNPTPPPKKLRLPPQARPAHLRAPWHPQEGRAAAVGAARRLRRRHGPQPLRGRRRGHPGHPRVGLRRLRRHHVGADPRDQAPRRRAGHVGYLAGRVPWWRVSLRTLPALPRFFPPLFYLFGIGDAKVNLRGSY